jgi:hypothetical protein
MQLEGIGKLRKNHYFNWSRIRDHPAVSLCRNQLRYRVPRCKTVVCYNLTDVSGEGATLIFMLEEYAALANKQQTFPFLIITLQNICALYYCKTQSVLQQHSVSLTLSAYPAYLFVLKMEAGFRSRSSVTFSHTASAIP